MIFFDYSLKTFCQPFDQKSLSWQLDRQFLDNRRPFDRK